MVDIYPIRTYLIQNNISDKKITPCIEDIVLSCVVGNDIPDRTRTVLEDACISVLNVLSLGIALVGDNHLDKQVNEIRYLSDNAWLLIMGG